MMMITMIFPLIEHLLCVKLQCNLYHLHILLLSLTTTSKVDAVPLILQIEIQSGQRLSSLLEITLPFRAELELSLQNVCFLLLCHTSPNIWEPS